MSFLASDITIQYSEYSGILSRRSVAPTSLQTDHSKLNISFLTLEIKKNKIMLFNL